MSKTKTRPLTIRFEEPQLARLRSEAERTRLHLQDVIRLCIWAGLDSWPTVLAAKPSPQEVTQ